MADDKIQPDAVIRADDFIDEAEKDATPANDEGRGIKLEDDGLLHPYFSRHGLEMIAGETLNGATLPVPVYQNKTDNELYACDANDNTKYKFIGFVVTNSTDGNPIRFQGSGVVGGFTGLQEGEKYYVQDTVGTIGTTVGTQPILVGIAVSETELLITKMPLFAQGKQSFTATTTQAITLGFRPTRIRIHAVWGLWDAGDEKLITSNGGWSEQGGNDCVSLQYHPGSAIARGQEHAEAWHASTGSDGHSGTITTITDTGFTFDNTEDGGTGTVYIFWEAEGYL